MDYETPNLMLQRLNWLSRCLPPFENKAMAKPLYFLLGGP